MRSDSMERKGKITLVLCNLLVILFTVAVSVVCASRLHQEQMNNKRDEFIAMVESMKSVAQNYLDGERGYVENWSAYIRAYLKTVNRPKQRVFSTCWAPFFLAIPRVFLQKNGFIRRKVPRRLSYFRFSDRPNWSSV